MSDAEDAAAVGQLADCGMRLLGDAGRHEALEPLAGGIEDAERRVLRSGQVCGRLDELLEHRVERELRRESDPRLDERLRPIRRNIHPRWRISVAYADVRVRDTADAVRARRRDSVSMSRRVLVIGAVVLAVVVAGALVAIFSLRSSAEPQASAVLGGPKVANMLRGIPQDGTALGSPTAPVTLHEFADPQCPYCGAWERDGLPTIVSRYVRQGKVRIVFDGMAFVGPDSATALRTAFAAAGQNRLWNVLALLYENQGTENTGWVTEPLLRGVGAAVPGLDTERMLADRSSTGVDNAVAKASALAQQLGVNSTPTFAVGATGGQMQLVDAAGLTAALDAALSR